MHQLVQVVAFLVQLVAPLGTKPLTVARVTSTHPDQPDQPVHVLLLAQIVGHPASGADADRATQAGELLPAAGVRRPVRDAIRDVPESTTTPLRLQACPAGRGPSGGLGHLGTFPGTFSGTSRCCRRAMSTPCTNPCRDTCLAGSGCADGRRR